MDDNPTKSELLARVKTLEAALTALEKTRHDGQAGQRESALRDISSGISHNLNNLLTGMLLQAELIETSTRDPEILECVRDIIRTGRRGADLVARLGLALRENVPDAPHPIDLKTAVVEAVENSRAIWEGGTKLEGRDIRLSLDIPDHLPPVVATESGLIDIVIDLIQNAEEAMPEGGTIEIGAESVEGAVRLIVRDDGIGMDAETMVRARDPFFTTKKDVGSGLGLSTIEGLVVTWGGSLHIASEPGKGTTVRVNFAVAR